MSVVAAQRAASGHSTTVSGAAVVSPSRLELAHLETSACRFFASGLADSTRKAYASGQARYLKFCDRFSFIPLSTSEHRLCLFVSHLAEEGLSHKTIKSYLSAVRHLQIQAGLGDPFTATLPQLAYVLKGIRRQQGPRLKVDKRLPITPAELRILKDVWAKRSPFYDAAMLWAAVCTGFFGFMRAREFTVSSVAAFDASVHLAPQDVSIDSHVTPSVVRIHLKQSKTDPFRQGVNIFLGRSKQEICPVAALLSYMALRGNAQGPLFLYDDGTSLSRNRLVREVQRALTEAGRECTGFTGHSFRIGAATTAKARGLDDSTIKALGRCKSTAFESYIRIPGSSLAGFSQSLV